MKVLDLFCGCGGFSLGFAPKNEMIGVDIWKVAGDSWQANIDGEFILADILEWDYSVIGKIDILIGSPPCQDFSLINKGRASWKNDTIKIDTRRVDRFLEIRDALKPKYWVMEEVPEVVKYAPLVGRYLKASDFGLPHERKRLFAGNYPLPPTRKYTGPLVPTPLASQRGYYACWGKKDEYINRFQEVMHTRSRYPTIAHYKKLMGFPLKYKLFGTRTDQYKQLGNAVAVPISRAICNAIGKCLRIEDFVRKYVKVNGNVEK